MSKKLMLLAAGALTALAFAALPAVASAGEFPIHCASPVNGNCNSNVTGGTAELNNTNNEGVHCTSVSGTASTVNNGSTGTAQLTFHGCTAFGFSCNSTGQPSNTIKTNVMNSRLVYIDPGETTPGVTLSGINVTFSCAGGLVRKTVTGSIIGHFEDESKKCGQTVASMAVQFEKTINGHQKWNQVTTSGPIDDLISNNDAGGAYVTSSQTGTGTLTSTTGLTALTCNPNPA